MINRRDILSYFTGFIASVPFIGTTVTSSISQKIIKSPFWDSGKLIKGTIHAQITDNYPFYHNDLIDILPSFPILYSVDIEYENGCESYQCYNVSIEHLSKFSVQNFLAGIKSEPLENGKNLCPDIIWEGYRFRMSFIMAKDELGNLDFSGKISNT